VNNQKSSGNGGIGIMGIVIVLVVIYLLRSCSNSKYESDFEKHNSGESVIEDAHNAVKDANDRQERNTDKIYSEWDD